MKYIILGIILLLSACSNVESISTGENTGTGEEVTHEQISETQEKTNGTPVEEKQIGEQIAYDDLSLQTVMQEEITGSNLELEQILSQNSQYTRYRISYMNGDLKLSGIMNIPVGTGPFPLLVLNHGYIDTRYYTNGRGLKREQDYFARNDFALIHPDYRNHAFSDSVDESPYDFRLGYTRDVIASIKAIQNSKLEELQGINSSKVGMLGHSMGGGITQNIAVSKPDLIDAVVLYGPVSNNEYKNFEKFQLSNSTRGARVQQVLSQHKNPVENPIFWNGVSSKTFFENILAPVMIFTGTADDSTPTQWAQDIAQDLKELEKDVTIVSYPGEGHEFGPKWNDFMKQSGNFFNTHLK